MPGAPFEIRSNGTPLAASPFSIASRSATWSVATRSSVPAARPAHIAVAVVGRAERRRDARLRDLEGIAGRVAIVGQGEVVRTGLGVRPHPGRARFRDVPKCRGARQVDDVDGRVGGVRERHRAMGRDGLGLGRSRGRVIPRCRVAAPERRLDRRVDQDGVLAVELEHPAPLAEHAHRLEDRAVREPEVEDHERLGGRNARVDHRRQLGDRVVHATEDRRAEREVDRGIGRGDPPELADAGQDRAMGGRRRPRPRVVEREERRRAAERRGDRVLEEAVGLVVGGDARVGMDIDDAGQHEQPRRIDDLAGRDGGPGEVRFDRFDGAAADGDVGAERSLGGDHGAAADDEVGHHAGGVSPRPRGSRSTGRPPTGSAGPSRAAGRPSRRRRRPSRNGWPPAGRPWTPSCSRRTGRRSRIR